MDVLPELTPLPGDDSPSAGGENELFTTGYTKDLQISYYLYDYRGARFYDADLGRFLSVDPLAKKYAAWSPYAYVLDNPVMLVDPDGKAASPPVKVLYWDYVFAAGASGAGAVGAKAQRGIAYDDYGVTLFEASNSTAFSGIGPRATDGDMPDHIATGLDIGVGIGTLVDNASSTFDEYAAKHSTVSFAGGPVDIEVGDNTYGADISLGFGVAWYKMNLNINESLSLSNAEFSQLGGLATVFSSEISVGNITATYNSSGQMTGYSGEVIVRGLFRTRRTGIMVTSGVKATENGRSAPDELWKSQTYRSLTESTEDE